MLINSRHLGEIEVDETKIIQFPEGLPGFPDIHQFLLLPHGEDSPFYFLQSTEQPEVAFVTTAPQYFFPQYRPQIELNELASLSLESLTGADVLVILTIPSDPKMMTANLVAPLIINPVTRQGKQVVLAGSCYSTRHRVFLPESQTAEQSNQKKTAVSAGA